MLKTMSPEDARKWLDEGRAVLVDVREPAEFAREHIVGARLVPLSAFDRADFEAERGKAAVFTCRSGARTAGAAARILGSGFREVYALEGGIEGWKKAGLPVHFDRRAPIDLMRQVQIVAGLLILAGVVLGALVAPGFYGLAAFVGAGLLFAGVTGFCGMARLLARMPWNRRAAAA